MEKIKAVYHVITHPYVQISIGWIMVLGSVIGWPLSLFTWARTEPPFILSLSWCALIFSGYAVVSAGHADLRTYRQDHK